MTADKAGEQAPERTFLERDGADFCHMTFVGDISGEEMRRVLNVQKEVMEGCDYVLLLIDMKRMGNVSPEARKIGAEASSINVIGTAIYGASFTIRTLAKLVTTASTILRGAKTSDSPVVFFETEAEGRAWVDKRRAEYLSRRST